MTPGKVVWPDQHSLSLLTLMGYTVYWPLICGIKGREGATGGPGGGWLLNHRRWFNEAAVHGILQVMVSHWKEREQRVDGSAPVLLLRLSPGSSMHKIWCRK